MLGRGKGYTSREGAKERNTGKGLKEQVERQRLNNWELVRNCAGMKEITEQKGNWKQMED